MLKVYRCLLLAGVVVIMGGCAVNAPDMPTEPMTASVELEGSPALSLLHKAEAARQQGET